MKSVVLCIGSFAETETCVFYEILLLLSKKEWKAASWFSSGRQNKTNFFTTAMSHSTRYNSFNKIHKALRSVLFETIMDMQKADLSKAQPELIEKVFQIVDMIHHHGKNEDAYMFNRLIESNQEIGKELNDDHVADDKLGAELLDLTSKWKAAMDDTRLDAATDAFHKLTEFTAFNLNHMTKEETTFNSGYWKHYTDDEIRQFEHELVSSLDPHSIMALNGIMFKNINDPELKGFLAELKMGLPEHIYQVVLQSAIDCVGADRVNKLTM